MFTVIAFILGPIFVRLLGGTVARFLTLLAVAQPCFGLAGGFAVAVVVTVHLRHNDISKEVCDGL